MLDYGCRELIELKGVRWMMVQCIGTREEVRGQSLLTSRKDAVADGLFDDFEPVWGVCDRPVIGFFAPVQALCGSADCLSREREKVSNGG